MILTWRLLKESIPRYAALAFSKQGEFLRGNTAKDEGATCVVPSFLGIIRVLTVIPAKRSVREVIKVFCFCERLSPKFGFLM